MLPYLYDSSTLNTVYFICTFYVFVKILNKLWSLTADYILPKFNEPKDFKTYGQWAVITGSTDGIGKQFAMKLASFGVDICLISRNEEKLQNTAKEIEQNYEVKTKYITADFTDPNIYEGIRKQLIGLDIGILVNNVGMFNDRLQTYRNFDEKLIKDYINVNMLSMAMMTSIILPFMVPKQKGLIVNISSTCGEIVLPYFNLYSATKAFMIMLSKSISYELKKYNIQVKTLTPGFVCTNLVHKHSKASEILYKMPFIMIPVEKYVENAIQTFTSNNNTSCGIVEHEIYYMLTKLCPSEILTRGVSILFKDARNKI